MKNIEFFAPGPLGEIAKNALSYSSVVKMGNMIQIAGQGSWNDNFEITAATLDEEIEMACNNVEYMLNSVGASWENVISVVSYHVGMDRAGELMSAQFKKRIASHCPIWTGVGVAALALPTQHVEVVVTAMIED